MALTTFLGITKLDASTKQPELVINPGSDSFDSTLAGRLTKSVAGNSNVTLTDAEGRNTRMELTGALTGSIVVFIRMPGAATNPGYSARRFTVFNNTTGAFTLTVKTTAAGSTGITVPQGYTIMLEHDGTNVVAVGPLMTASGLFVPQARAYHNAAQSIANNSETVLALNSERFDTDAIHDTVTNNSRLTCKTAGLYLIQGVVEFATNGTGYRQFTPKLNGTTYLGGTLANPLSAATTVMTFSTLYQLVVGDYVEVTVFQNSGGALNVNSSGNYSPEFAMAKVG